MFVKICGITSEDDALLAVALGADAIGFIFAPSVRQVAVQKVYDITRRIPPEILTVGVFRDEHPKRVIELVDLENGHTIFMGCKENTREYSLKKSQKTLSSMFL